MQQVQSTFKTSCTASFEKEKISWLFGVALVLNSSTKKLDYLQQKLTLICDSLFKESVQLLLQLF
jgi:hypothetical protein